VPTIVRAARVAMAPSTPNEISIFDNQRLRAATEFELVFCDASLVGEAVVDRASIDDDDDEQEEEDEDDENDDGAGTLEGRTKPSTTSWYVGGRAGEGEDNDSFVAMVLSVSEGLVFAGDCDNRCRSFAANSSNMRSKIGRNSVPFRDGSIRVLPNTWT